MQRQKSNQPTGASAWAVSDLTEAYQANSAALTRRAFRYLQNEQQAEDVVQEAFIKVLLAAPELNDAEHLIAYLNKTVTNLCLDIRKSQNRGPLLVAVDSETSADLLDDLAHETHVELDETLTRAEDAAIVREAISRLSEVDRAVLLSIHLEQKTTAETAKQFGVTEGTVRNALMRARRNLRTTLEEWIIDEETGMTAAQYLSRTGKKIAENSKKIGSAALSLVLLVAAFFGFWNNPTSPAQVASPSTTTKPTTIATPPVSKDVKILADEPSEEVLENVRQQLVDFLTIAGAGFYSLVSAKTWPGLDENGVPKGFTTNDGAVLTGDATVFSLPSEVTPEGSISSTSQFVSTSGINLALQQTVLSVPGSPLRYAVDPFVRINGAWVELKSLSQVLDSKKLADGTVLLSVTFKVDRESLGTTFQSPAVGTDLIRVPDYLLIYIHTSAAGTPIFGQAVQVLTPPFEVSK